MKLWSKAQSRSRIRLNRKCWQQKPYKTNCQKINFSFLKMIAMSSPAKPQSKPNISMAFVWIIKSLQFGSIVRTLGFLYATKKCNSHASFHHRQRGIVVSVSVQRQFFALKTVHYRVHGMVLWIVVVVILWLWVFWGGWELEHLNQVCVYL